MSRVLAILVLGGLPAWPQSADVFPPSQPAGTGNVTGPTSSTGSDLACFSGTSGAVLADCGIMATGGQLFFTSATVPSSVVAYSNLNVAARASTTLLNTGINLYASSGLNWGLDFGYDTAASKYQTRLYANTGNGEIAGCFDAATPTAQSGFSCPFVLLPGSVNFAIPETAASYGGNGSAPSAAVGSSAGTSPGTPAVTGTNVSGVVSVSTGTATTTNGTLLTMTAAGGGFASTPEGCQITARNAASAAASLTVFTTAPSSTAWTIAVGATALSASKLYSWSYACL